METTEYKDKIIKIDYDPDAEKPYIDCLIYAPNCDFIESNYTSDYNIPSYKFNLYVYRHGNILLSTKPFNCQFDSAFVGYVYFPTQGLERERIEDICNSYLEEYAQWLNGEIYQCTIYEKCKCCSHEKFIHSFGQFYSIEDAIESGKDFIDYEL